jgi:hypothetical protein
MGPLCVNLHPCPTVRPRLKGVLPQHRLTKQIPNNLRSDIPLVLITALRLRARIPIDRFDFDRAKADVIARTSL